MKSYFFIPANKEKYLVNASNLSANEIILDLEDAIFNSSVEKAVENIIEYNISHEFFIRILYFPTKNIDQLSYLTRLLKSGFNKFVIPKIESKKELEEIIFFLGSENSRNKDLKLIVLIENPLALQNISKISKLEEIHSIGFGSHDYCAFIGMKHTIENLFWARMKLLNAGKAANIEVIDIASMNLNNEEDFTLECINGFEKGFDAKFIIHPWQLNIFNSIQYYSEKEIELALKVQSHIKKIGGERNFTIVRIDGEVIEKPHLKRINRLIKTIGNEGI